MKIYKKSSKATRWLRTCSFIPMLALPLFANAQQASQGNTTVFGGAEITVFGAHNFVTGGSGTQPGIVKTIRTSPFGVLKFGPAATQSAANDANHVDGYVSKIGNTAFTFPTGNGTDLRTLSISAPSTTTSQVTVAWFNGNPGTVNDPSDASTHSISSLDGTLISVSQAGFWDWIPVTGSFSGLTVTASIPDLTAYSAAADLRLAGWNGTQWVSLSATGNATGNTEGSTISGTIPATGTISALAIGSVTPLATDPVPFACSTSSYQVVGEGSFSRLYEYDIVTGVRNSVALLDHYVNAIGFNNVDNLIWGYAPNTNELVRIDASGTVTPYVIPNLPQSAYNVGDVMNGGYLFLYAQASASYYVVDINPSRTATYLKLVDPTAAYALETAPFGTNITPIGITDWSYNPQTGLFYTLQNGTAAITTLNPTTGELVIASTPVSGAGITSDAAAFGATFLDNAGNLYAFSNGTGKFYKINLASNTATFMSTSTPSGANDGARCNLAEVTPAVPFACTTSSYQVASTGSSVPSTLYQYNISTGLRTSVATLDRYVNAIGYNNVDNLMWGYAPNTNEVARIDASGAVAGFIIPNLPKISFNVGDVMNGGYLFLYSQNNSNFYVVDVNPARPATYLKLVDPTAGYALEAAPYGTAMSALAISDWSYNPKDGLFYALQSFTAVLATLNPATGAVSVKPASVVSTGANIAGDAQSGFGATFLDNEGNLYVFANGSGNFYRIDAAANTALLMSTSIASIANDGARCNLAAPIPLPVTLVSFTVEKNGSENPSAVLRWSTSSETNSDHFEIERSETGKNWANIGNVLSSGESTALLSYSFKDNEPKSGENLYRLRMVDRDGTFAYSRIQSVTFDGRDTDLSVYPNPSADKLFIRDYSTVKYVAVSNLSGVAVYKSTSFASGNGFIDLTNLSQGMYIVRISRTNGTISTHKVVVGQ
ncbi:T9SS type A sorting domain-containing protein [Dyadobacter sp. CY356]|uniref:T9SS type A sorting domain-containing protein n=1 Tax=Dyadobacter sp. CY356 TaxID=2906442 RepID=UPI001F1DE49D|nr:T9SS type A sorting domain-containing protein [Dyadobacter sp. CY356]MCF0056284.1 T9SS type A sorting domain-containing protein [Dyadobacter sp. CY356]